MSGRTASVVKSPYLVLFVILASVMVGTISLANAQSESLPTWMKNTAGFWSEDQISDAEFITFIQFLINDGIISIPQDSESNNVHKELSQEDSCNKFYYDMVEMTSYFVGLEQKRMAVLIAEGFSQDKSVQQDLENVKDEIKRLQTEGVLKFKDMMEGLPEGGLSYCKDILTKTQIDTIIFLDEGTIT